MHLNKHLCYFSGCVLELLLLRLVVFWRTGMPDSLVNTIGNFRAWNDSLISLQAPLCPPPRLTPLYTSAPRPQGSRSSCLCCTARGSHRCSAWVERINAPVQSVIPRAHHTTSALDRSICSVSANSHIVCLVGPSKPALTSLMGTDALGLH